MPWDGALPDFFGCLRVTSWPELSLESQSHDSIRVLVVIRELEWAGGLNMLRHFLPFSLRPSSFLRALVCFPSSECSVPTGMGAEGPQQLEGWC